MEAQLQVWNDMRLVVVVIGVLDELEEEVGLGVVQVARQPACGSTRGPTTTAASVRTSHRPSPVFLSVTLPPGHRVNHPRRHQLIHGSC